MAPPDSRKRRLLSAFDSAAAGYDRHAPVQRTAAARLADRIAALSLPEQPRILEVGCGTGFLSEALRRRLGPADWTITDLSPAMLSACRTRLGDPKDARFLVLDGERPALDGEPFDLICASLALQWLDDLGGALVGLKRLLKPGGYLAFATLADGTLGAWRQAHADEGLEAGTPEFPTVAALQAAAGGSVEGEWLVEGHADGRAFLKSLKGIGAHTPADGRRPLDHGELGRVLRRFEASGSVAAYHVAYGIARRPRAGGAFVTGTDTGIGKTVVSACLALAWGADYWKPVQTGLARDEGDTAMVSRLAGLPPERLHTPAYALDAPLSPHLAAAREGADIRLEDLVLPASELPIVVEGAGGPLVPLNGRVLMVDLMVRLALPVVLVAPNRLGAINQTLLALEALKARGLPVLGVVLIGTPFADNRAAIETHGRVKVLAELPWAETLDDEAVARWSLLMPACPTP